MSTPQQHRARRWPGAVVGIAVFVGALVCFRYAIGRPVAWTDEAVTFATLQRSWPQLMLLSQGSDAPLLPYYVLAKAWSDAFVALGVPYTIGLVRGFSALVGAIAALFLSLVVSKRLGNVSGFVAGALFVALPGASRYAQEARPYALLIAATAVTFWAFDHWNSPPEQEASRNRRALIAVVLVASLSLIPLASLFGLLQWAVIGVIALCCAAAWPQHGWLARRALLLAPMGAAAVLMVWPVVQMASLGHGPSAAHRPTAELLATNVRGVLFSPEPPPVWAVAALALLVLSSLLGLRHDATRRFLGSLWIWFLVPLVGGIVATLLHPAFLRIRYWTPLLLPISALAAAGAAELWRSLAKLQPPAVGRAIAGIVVAALLGGVVVGGLPNQADVRSREGHGNHSLAAVKKARQLVRDHPGAEIMIDGAGALYFIVGSAPDLVEVNILADPDPTSVNVWQVPTSKSERRARLGQTDAVVWIHYEPQTKRKAYSGLDKLLTRAGFQETLKTTKHNWRVSLHER